MSTDAGGAWSEVDSYFDDGFCLAWSSSNPDIVFAGGQGGTSPYKFSVASSSNGGASWPSHQDLGSSSGQCRALAISPGSADLVFAVGDEGSYGRVYRTTDGGATWDNRSAQLDTLHSGTWKAWSACMNHRGTLFVGTDEGLFATTNGAAAWHSTGLSGGVRSVLYDPCRKALYAAVYGNGVYRSTDQGETWDLLGTDLGNDSTLVLGLDPNPGHLFLGTHGGGVWRLPLPPICGIEVLSDCDSITPPIGTYTNLSGATLTNSAVSLHTHGTTQYVCTGWALSGQCDIHGQSTGTGTVVVIAHTNDVVLQWRWNTDFWLDTGSTGSGSAYPGDGWKAHNSHVGITADPDTHWHFAQWTGNGTNWFHTGDIHAATASVTIVQPISIVAEFHANLASNQTPHWWLALHDLTNRQWDVEALDDVDHDGMPAWKEYVCDTDPTNVQSVLAVTGISLSNGQACVTWKGGVWATQRLRIGTSLDDMSAWQAIHTNPYPTDTTGRYEGPWPAGKSIFCGIEAER